MTDPADRALALSLSETHWRDMMDAAFCGDMDRATAILGQLEQRISEVAAQLPFDRRAEFLAATEEERDKLFEEYRRNPDALKRRLGAATAQPIVNRPPPPRPVASHPIADAVVRTAVRATVWETVRAIFRGL